MVVTLPPTQGKGLMTTFWVLGINEETTAEGKGMNPFQRQKQKASLPVIQYPLPEDTSANHLPLSAVPTVQSLGEQTSVPISAVRRKTSPFDWPQADRRLSHSNVEGPRNHGGMGSVDLLVSENTRPYNLAERRSSLAGIVPRPLPTLNGVPPAPVASRNDSLVSEYCIGRMRDSLAQRNSSIVSDYNMARIRESLILTPIHEGGIQPQIAALASLAEENARRARALADELAHLAMKATDGHPTHKTSQDPFGTHTAPSPQPPPGCPLWDTPVDPPSGGPPQSSGGPPQSSGGHKVQDTAAAGQSCVLM